MKNLSAILLVSGLIGGGLASPLFAETTPATAPGAPTTTAAQPGAAADPAKTASADDQAMQRSAAADRAALFEAHLAALRAGLTLTPDQDKLWPPVEQAIRGFASMRLHMRDMHSDARQDRQDEQDTEDAAQNEDPIGALKTYSTALYERAEALKALSDAADPLYAMLTDEQKRRIPMLLRDMAPKRGPLARLIERFGDEQDHGRGDRMNGDREGDRMDRMDRMRHGERGPSDRDGRADRSWDGADDRFGNGDEPRSGMNDDHGRDGEDGMSFHHRHRYHDGMRQDGGDDRGEDRGED